MMGLTPTTPGDDRPGPPSVPGSRSELSAIVKTTEDGRRSCTIYSADATGIDRMSQWITANGDSYVEVGTAE